MEGSLKFDPTMGGLMVAGSINQEKNPKKIALIPSNKHPTINTDADTHNTISKPPTSCIDIETTTIYMGVFCRWKRNGWTKPSPSELLQG